MSTKLILFKSFNTSFAKNFASDNTLNNIKITVALTMELILSLLKNEHILVNNENSTYNAIIVRTVRIKY
ncbi:MAG: hypothetical protein ACLT53_06355 [Clostridium cadaveris]